MKRFDLNAMGVQEMSHSEMVKTDGGIGPLAVLVVAVIAIASSSCINHTTENNYYIEGDNNNVGTTGDKNTGNGNGNKDNGSNNGTNNQKK